MIDGYRFEILGFTYGFQRTSGQNYRAEKIVPSGVRGQIRLSAGKMEPL